MECTVIIPVIEPSSLLTKIILKTLEIDSNLKIIVLYNKLSKLDEHLDNNRIKLVQTNEKNMSAKRNIGVNLANSKYVAFLDSDAYPAKNWFINAKKLLDDDFKIGIVTGPELSFPDQNFIENAVGICNRSFLILGSHNFRKSISKSRYYSEASACNIIMKKNDYQDVGGMDAELYLGEDQEFSHRFTKMTEKKILFSSDVRIFHKDRGFKGYLVQRYARGLTATNLKDKLKSFFNNTSIKNFIKQRFELFLPFLFIIFLISAPIFLMSKLLTILFFSILVLYVSIISFESARLTKNKFIYFPIVFLFLIIGSIAPGFALFFKLLNLKMNIKKLYRNT